MRIGILGGTGPAGRGLAVRLAAAGDEVVIGSRDADRAAAVAAGLVGGLARPSPGRSPEPPTRTRGGCDLVVVATPWDSAVATVRPLAPSPGGQGGGVDGQRPGQGGPGVPGPGPAPGLGGRHRPGRPAPVAGVGLLPPPAASEMEKLDTPIVADVLVCSDHPEATEATVALVDRIDGLRGIDAGSLSQAAPIEAFTAVLITVNIRHKVHAAVQLAGYPATA